MHKLSRDQISFWKSNSYLTIRGLFEDQIGQISEKVNELAQWEPSKSKWLNFYEMDNVDVLSRIENFCPYHEYLSGILTGELIIDIISQLMGEEAVLYKDRINFKSPGGGAHSAHQDGVAYESSDNAEFDLSTAPFISILISIDPATEENGCLEVVPEWALDDPKILPMERPFPDHPNFSKISQQIEDSLIWNPIETNPGDVLFFTERLPHRSKKNTSDKNRRILYGVYNPLSVGDKRQSYFDEKKKHINDARYMVGNPHAPVK